MQRRIIPWKLFFQLLIRAWVIGGNYFKIYVPPRKNVQLLVCCILYVQVLYTTYDCLSQKKSIIQDDEVREMQKK